MLGLDAVLLLGAEEWHNGPLPGLDAVVLQGAEEWHNGQMPGLEFSCLFFAKTMNGSVGLCKINKAPK